MRRTVLLAKALLAFIKLPAIGFAALMAVLSGNAPQTQPADSSVAGLTAFDATGAGTTASALQGTAAFGINASGEVAGIETDTAGVHHGFVRAADGTITEFDAPGFTKSGFSNVGTYALGINASGEIVGFYTSATENHYHGYVRSAAGAFTQFDVPGSNVEATNAFAINAGGDVTGFYTAQGLDYGIPAHGFVRLADGTIATFDAPGAGTTGNQGTRPVAINAAGTVTGFYRDSKNAFHGFVRSSGGSIMNLDISGAGTAGYQGTLPTAIDAAGDIAGLSFDSNGVAHGFLHAASGSVTSFDVTGAGTGMLQGTFPIAMNSSGAIVGIYFDAKYVLHGFSRGADGTLATLNAPGAGSGVGISPSNAGIGEITQSFQGTGAVGINDAGAISGSYLDANSVTHGFVIAAPAAVPATFALTGSAVSVNPGAVTGNTSTITVTPSGGFTGAVALTASVTASPTGAQDPPTLSFGTTTPVNISGATAGTATLTISTTASSKASNESPRHPALRWYAAGSAVMACVVFFGAPGRRYRWTKLLSLILFAGAISGGILGCSGSSPVAPPNGPTNPGTTAGSYTVTVTGTSGSTTNSGVITLTVQ